jgi:hypothetical protein
MDAADLVSLSLPDWKKVSYLQPTERIQKQNSSARAKKHSIAEIIPDSTRRQRQQEGNKRAKQVTESKKGLEKQKATRAAIIIPGSIRNKINDFRGVQGGYTGGL